MMSSRRWRTMACLMAHLVGLLLVEVTWAQNGDDSYLGERSWLQEEGGDTSADTRGESKSYRYGIIGSAVGIVAGVGLAVWVKREADRRYDEYQITADQDDAASLFDSAQRYDRATIIGWGLAQVSFVALLYFLTREDERPLVPVEGEPLVRTWEDGIELGFRFTP